MRTVSRYSSTRKLQRRTIASLLISVALVSLTAEVAHAVVRRRLNVNSNPPGALVYVDNQQIGTTPCSVDFTYYGTREIRLIKPGFETLTVNQPIPAPWYEYIPIDFIAENFVTTKIRDNRTVNYNLAPQIVVPVQELIDRGNQLRQDTLQYGVAPAGPTPVAAPGQPIALPPTSVPEPLPGINPPPFNPPAIPQPTPAPPPAGTPLLPPRL